MLPQSHLVNHVRHCVHTWSPTSCQLVPLPVGPPDSESVYVQQLSNTHLCIWSPVSASLSVVSAGCEPQIRGHKLPKETRSNKKQQEIGKRSRRDQEEIEKSSRRVREEFEKRSRGDREEIEKGSRRDREEIEKISRRGHKGRRGQRTGEDRGYKQRHSRHPGATQVMCSSC